MAYCEHPALVDDPWRCEKCGATGRRLVQDLFERNRNYSRVLGEEEEANELKDIVEIVEVGGREVNHFLNAGYRLLSIEQKTWLAEARGTVYVRKDLRYVMGRTISVRHIDRPPLEGAANDGSRPTAPTTVANGRPVVT